MCFTSVSDLLCFQAYYYCAILEDVILRFAWAIPLTLKVLKIPDPTLKIVTTILPPLEVFR